MNEKSSYSGNIACANDALLVKIEPSFYIIIKTSLNNDGMARNASAVIKVHHIRIFSSGSIVSSWFRHVAIFFIAFAWIRFNVRSDLPFSDPHIFSYSTIVFAQSSPSIKCVWTRKSSSRVSNSIQLSVTLFWRSRHPAAHLRSHSIIRYPKLLIMFCMCVLKKMREAI